MFSFKFCYLPVNTSCVPTNKGKETVSLQVVDVVYCSMTIRHRILSLVVVLYSERGVACGAEDHLDIS